MMFSSIVDQSLTQIADFLRSQNKSSNCGWRDLSWHYFVQEGKILSACLSRFQQSACLWQKLRKGSVSSCWWIPESCSEARLGSRAVCGRTDPCVGTQGQKSIVVSYHLSERIKLTDYLTGCSCGERKQRGNADAHEIQLFDQIHRCCCHHVKFIVNQNNLGKKIDMWIWWATQEFIASVSLLEVR